MDADTGRLDFPPEILSHYGDGREQERLRRGRNRLELARTQQILQRFLPAPPAQILDIGGGPGEYAAWLARSGYDVHLLDATPLHVEQARETARRQPSHPFAADMGDARSLPFSTASADAVLLLGPLYHLTEREDRVRALQEALRVLRPEGLLAAAAISRFAPLFDGLQFHFLDDPDFVRIVERDLREGQHRNPSNHPHYFTTAFFHHPDELAGEVIEAGFEIEAVLLVEGPGLFVPDLDVWWHDQERRERLLQFIAAVEREPSLLGLGGHLLALARPPGDHHE